MLAFVAWAFVHQSADAAVTRAWVRQNTGVVSNSQDVAAAILRDPFGNIIVAGNVEDGFQGADMLLLKYSADGSLLWHRRFSGPTNTYGFISDAAVDAHGNIAVTGYSANGQDNDYYTAKFSPQGTLLWTRTYDGPSDDSALAVTFDGNGNVIVTGGSSQDEWRNDDDGNTRYDYYTAKYAAANGVVLWERRYNGPGNGRDRALAVAVDASNNVIVTGSSSGELGMDQYTTKYGAADGAMLWERRQPGFEAGALALDASGNVIVGGGSAGGAHTVKYSGADGTLLWERLRNGFGGVGAVVVDESGNVIVTGGLDPGTGRAEAYTAKYAEADGTVLWEQLYNDPAYYHRSGQAVAVDGSGNVIMGGFALNADGWTADQYVARYGGSDGAVLWQRLQRGPNIYAGAVAGLVLDEAGNVFVTGSATAGKDLDIRTSKFAGADGATLWQQYYNGPAHRAGEGRAAVIDSHGNVIVTGDSEGEDTDMDYLTVKYAPNGAVLWERRYNGPADGDDSPRGGVALDPQGNVVVTGESFGVGSSTDYYTAKYAASDGALLWEQRYNGPANQGDGARALAVDRDGNVLVTGFSYKANFVADFYTVKYAAGDGAVAWERRFTMPTGYAAAEGIAVDGRGNVVVTGSVWTGPSSNRSDIYTVKYAASDGQTLWDRQYNSPDNDYDEAVAVAMDGEGNVFVTARSDDSYTVKYAAATGEVIWEQNQNRGYPWALAVDARGDVVVTSGNTYTVKYAASNGALLWDRTIEDSPNQTTFTRAIAADTLGNVLLGGMFNNGNNYDFFIAKYAGADGAVLWRINDDGPGHADDTVDSDLALAVGPNGMVALTGSSGGYYPFANDFTTVVYRDAALPPDPSVNIFALDPFARERSFFHRADTASFLVHRSGSLKTDLTVYYDLSGSASNGVDYLQLPGRVTIRAGHSVALVVIAPRRDSVREGREDVRITLRPPPAGSSTYRIGKYPQARVYIFE